MVKGEEVKHYQDFSCQDGLHSEAVSFDNVLNRGDETTSDKSVAND